MEKVLSVIKNSEHNWIICGDPCFFCLWDSRNRKNHYKKQKCPERSSFEPGSKNMLQKPLVHPIKILLPLLHIKLSLMEQFVKSLNKERDYFRYLGKKFPSISDAKLKAGIFDGPQIRKLLDDDKFTDSMDDREKAAWISFKEVAENFLGNFKSDNYKKIVKNILKKFQGQGCLMSIKLHFLHSHLEHFPENIGDCSEKQGERFQQDIEEMERHYQGRWDEHAMAEFCWLVKKDVAGESKKRKRKPPRRTFDDKRTRKRRTN